MKIHLERMKMLNIAYMGKGQGRTRVLVECVLGNGLQSRPQKDAESNSIKLRKGESCRLERIEIVLVRDL